MIRGKNSTPLQKIAKIFAKILCYSVLIQSAPRSRAGPQQKLPHQPQKIATNIYLLNRPQNILLTVPYETTKQRETCILTKECIYVKKKFGKNPRKTPTREFLFQWIQDFEALTPNNLARTIETVVVWWCCLFVRFLLEGVYVPWLWMFMKGIEQKHILLVSMNGFCSLLHHAKHACLIMDDELNILPISSHMKLTTVSSIIEDVHARFRTESHPEIVSRFNERFLLSLGSCEACLVVDDELNILPISSHMKLTTVSSIIEVSLTPHSISVEDDIEDGAKQIMEKMKTENVGQLNPELLQQYSIADREAGFEQALRSCSTISSSGLISVKSNRDKAVKNNKTADSKKRKRKGYMQTSSKRHPSK